MKKGLSLILSALMAVSAVSCSSKSKYVAGTYSGSGSGHNGIITVEVTVSDSKIESIEITDQSETAGISDNAINNMPKKIVDAQSTTVDAESGCTDSSQGIKDAVNDALKKAEEGDTSTHKNVDETYVSGTYTGEGQGYNGPITVDVTFSDSAILKVEVTSSKETEHVGTPAYDYILDDIREANGTGVDSISGATFTSAGVKEAVNDAAKQAKASDLDGFKTNTITYNPLTSVDKTWDVIVVGAGGAGMAAAAQAAQNGKTVCIIEENAEIGGNTLVSGGQFQSVMPYLVWDESNPDASTGTYNGETYNKVMSTSGCIDELKTILNWSEEEFDEDYYKKNDFVAGDITELSKHGVHSEYLPTLQALKTEIQTYLNWAQPQLDAGIPESKITLFSTINLHIFQTYYGGLRQSNDKKSWIYGDYDLVSQFINEGQDLKPWLEAQGSTFVEDTQTTLIGALWYRENQFIGADVDTDGDGKTESYDGRWGTYFVAPRQTVLNADSSNEIMLRTTAKSLILGDDGEVIGVKAVRYDGTEITARCNDGVILTTGGYSADLDEVEDTNEYWKKSYLTDSMGTTNRSSLQGDGIDMAEDAGADTTGMGYTQLMPLGWIDNGNLAFGGGDYAIYINPITGKRYVNETAERDVLSKAAFENGIEYNGTKGVYIEIANASSKIPGPYPYQDEDETNRQYVRTADELADLFDTLGLDTDAETVKETIEAYDKAIMNGEQPADASKSQASALIGSCEKDENGNWKQDTYTLENVELRVRLMAPSTHHTMGGLTVDTSRHVLDEKGNVIKGLYAAGEVTGGIHGGNRLGGNAIVEVFVSGRIAANALTSDSAE